MPLTQFLVLLCRSDALPGLLNAVHTKTWIAYDIFRRGCYGFAFYRALGHFSGTSWFFVLFRMTSLALPSFFQDHCARLIIIVDGLLFVLFLNYWIVPPSWRRLLLRLFLSLAAWLGPLLQLTHILRRLSLSSDIRGTLCRYARSWLPRRSFLKYIANSSSDFLIIGILGLHRVVTIIVLA